VPPVRERITNVLWPWGRIRALEREVTTLARDRDVWQHQALLMSDRYDKINETANQLRYTLRLYRNS
jgi:hypothetical protein